MLLVRIIIWICIMWMLFCASRDLKGTMIAFSLGYWAMTLWGYFKNG